MASIGDQRAYMKGQMLQNVQGSLDNLLAMYFQNRMEQQNLQLSKEENLLAGLFEQEYKTQRDYEGRLLDLGLSVPEEQQTSDYSDIVKNYTGDDGLLGLIDTLHKGALHKSSVMKGVLQSYNEGQQAGTQLESAGYTDIIPSPDDPYAEYMFSPEELAHVQGPQGALADFGFNPAVTGSDAFKKGFLASNRSKKDIDDSISKLLAREQQELSLKEGKFNLAMNYGVEQANVSGMKVMSTIQDRIGAELNLAGIIQLYGQEDSFDTLKGALGDITDGINIGDKKLSKNGHVSRMLATAISSTPNYAGDVNQANSKGFLDLAIDSNDKFQKVQATHMQYARLKGWTSVPPVGSVNYESMVEELLTNDEYKILHNIAQEYQLIGLWGNDIVAESISDVENIARISDAKEDWVRKLSYDLAEGGLDFDDSSNIIDKEIGNKYNSNYDNNLINEIYNESFIDEGFDQLEAYSDELSELNISLDTIKDGDLNITSEDMEDLLVRYDPDGIGADIIRKREGWEVGDPDDPARSGVMADAMEYWLGVRSITDALSGTDFSEDEFKELVNNPQQALIMWGGHYASPDFVSEKDRKRIPKDAWKNPETITTTQWKQIQRAWDHYMSPYVDKAGIYKLGTDPKDQLGKIVALSLSQIQPISK